MAVGTYWIVNDTTKKVIQGPFSWDDANVAITVSAPLRVVTQIPDGYTSTQADCASVAARVAALETRVLGEVKGAGTVPAITNVAGGTATVTVTLKAAVKDASGVPTTDYTPSIVLIPGLVVGTLKVQSTTVKTPQSVEVVVSSTGLVTAGQATVLVFADKN